MAARRAERMINLVLCLLSTRQFLTAEQIRRAVPGYEPDDATGRADEAFKRMFERDKAELRDLGIPLETGRTSLFDVEDGYRIARRDYELPTIEFDPAEAAAIGLASRLWQSATLGSAARTALLKLRAGGVEVDDTGAPGAFGPIDAGEPALATLLEAVRDRRVVRFDYRKPGAEVEGRTVEPWGALSWRGRWYLVGHDRDRADARVFRLSRLAGPVQPVGPAGAVTRPEGLELLAFVQNRRPDRSEAATVRVTGSAGARLRRMARDRPPPETGASPSRAPTTTGAEELIVDYTDLDALARVIAAAGTSAVALDPPELVERVVARLRVAAGASDGAAERPSARAGIR